MSKKETTSGREQGELSDKQLDGVAGGQEVRKMETIVVTAKREKPQDQVVKMGQIVVTAKRDKEPATTVASNEATTKKN